MMENGKTAVRAIMPGRVYRNEAISARAHCFFHQVEGLYIDENVSFADLKQTLYHFVQELYGGYAGAIPPVIFSVYRAIGRDDVSCTICKGAGCNMCKYSGWLRYWAAAWWTLTCGNCGIDSKNIPALPWHGWTHCHLKYVIRDLRLFSENDERFLKQFQTEII